MQLSLFDDLPIKQTKADLPMPVPPKRNFKNFASHENKQLLYDLFQAYYDARRNKRNKKSALQFEQYYESNLIELYNEIINRKYKIKPSVCFINDAYSCRKGKGTSYGINRLKYFVRACSNNYKDDCYILQLDIKGYFMAINRKLLFQKVKSTLEKFRYRKSGQARSEAFAQSEGLAVGKWDKIFDFELIYYLLELIIFNKPIENHILKGKRKD